MIQKTFGDSTLKVTPIGLGLAALGRPGYINLGHADDLNREYDVNSMEEHMHSVLDEAWNSGVRYFDAAQSYGRSEAFLGSWLRSRNIDPKDIVIGSKWGYTYTANWNVKAEIHEIKNHSFELLKRQWQQSKEYLGSYINLYQIHSATIESAVLDNAEVLNELSKMKALGILIGLSTSGPNQSDTIRKATTITIDGKRLFDSCQSTWNLLETSAGKALEEAHQAGIGIIIKEALANGRLTNRNTNPAFSGKLQLLQYKAMKMNTTVDTVALAAAVSRPWVDIVLCGAATSHQLQSNLKSLNIRWDEEIETELYSLRETPDQYWIERKELEWN